MNAAVPENVSRAIANISLDDKYTLESGLAFMSGVQALVRLPILQRQRDALLGKNTAGFISGYRGSPLGGYDQALWKAEKVLEKNHVVFKAGVNEELGATAVWGTQTLGYAFKEKHKYDGVFGIWYGKGPGVDRCSDVFKHANMGGTTPWGGVIAIAGDDHISKSSTAAHQSDHIFKACGSPVFFPANVQEILDLGLHAFALSRYAGVWSGMKTIQEIVESSATIDVSPNRVEIVIPQDFQMPEGGLHVRLPDTPLAQEERLMHYKWYAALAYIRANKLNYNVIESDNDKYGIMASGKAFNDLMQALHDLGLDKKACNELGIRVHKVGVVWPLEVQGTRAFASGLKEILVVEEKRQMIEYALKEELYNWSSAYRPNVVGKYDEGDGPIDKYHGSGGEWSLSNPSANALLRANADLSPALIAKALVRRLERTGILQQASADLQAQIKKQMQILNAKENSMLELSKNPLTGADRLPWFCAGCPHNTSTTVPEGSRAFGGIGCHYMATWMDRGTMGFTQMGGEGVPWVGQQPFTNEKHVFANLGDGTYFHSGLLAIRQSIASGTDITYKILYNDAVAMTGGQTVGERPEGHSVLQIAQSLKAEGVSKLVIVTDEPEKYEGVQIAGNPEVHHRDELGKIQKQMQETKGTSAIIYDQTCATEKRRRRKRGKAIDPAVRVMINEAVCEGCGDCSIQSNCVAVEPIETELGRKRAINQSTCNKDLSCLRGFCPSFVTIEGSQLKKQAKAEISPQIFIEKFVANSGDAEIPRPQIAQIPAKNPWGIIVAGVGGTGVITIGQLLGTAAHMEGKGIVTQDAAGLAQKGGATWSHVLIAQNQNDILTTRVGTAAADLILACDPLVGVNYETVSRILNGRTHIALNSSASPTAAFVKNPNWQNPQQDCAQQLKDMAGENHLGILNAEKAAKQLMGDTIFVNPMMLGFAWQKGQIPLIKESLMRAIELNNVAVAANKTAFEWGRIAAQYPKEFEKLIGETSGQERKINITLPQTLEQIVEKRIKLLTDYQDASYANQYKNFIDKVKNAESPLGSQLLTKTVAKYLYKLMAYKDEYEVARLHSDPEFLERIQNMMEGELGKDYKLSYYLAPPLSAKHDESGRLIKKKYPFSMLAKFKLLAKLKSLRGGIFDIFGKTKERQIERELIEKYKQSIEKILKTLSPQKHKLAVDIAKIPEEIRGYGHVKERHLQTAEKIWEQLMEKYEHFEEQSKKPATFQNAKKHEKTAELEEA